MISALVLQSFFCVEWSTLLDYFFSLIGNVPFCIYLPDRVVTWEQNRGKSIVRLEFAASIVDHEKRFTAFGI